MALMMMGKQLVPLVLARRLCKMHCLHVVVWCILVYCVWLSMSGQLNSSCIICASLAMTMKEFYYEKCEYRSTLLLI
jgi:hypothetical protein